MESRKNGKECVNNSVGNFLKSQLNKQNFWKIVILYTLVTQPSFLQQVANSWPNEALHTHLIIARNCNVEIRVHDVESYQWLMIMIN